MENTNMDMTDPDLSPSGASLPRPVAGPMRQTVAQFTATRNVDPSEIWEPFSRPTMQTSDGSRGNPYGSFRMGHGLEHEPVDRAERMATARTAAAFGGDEDRQPVPAHEEAGATIRAALRPGAF
jgi:hypothetical protein